MACDFSPRDALISNAITLNKYPFDAIPDFVISADISLLKNGLISFHLDSHYTYDIFISFLPYLKSSVISYSNFVDYDLSIYFTMLRMRHS